MHLKIDELARILMRIRDIENGFLDFHKYLQDHFPMDFSILSLYDFTSGDLTYKVASSSRRAVIIDETVKLSGKAKLEAKSKIAEKITVTNRPKESALASQASAHLGVENLSSSLDLVTCVAPRRYGHFGMLVKGEDRYGSQHVERAEKIYEAVGNAIHQFLDKIELAQLKEQITIENKELRKRLGYASETPIIGSDSALKDIIEQANAVALTDSPVLLLGETGVGKELIARAIHRGSKRSQNPLISLNCGAIPETLIESELFGHEKGSFTGAFERKRGYFEQANSGTIFLDEVGELPLQTQVKLLRALESGELQRIGGDRKFSVDFRLIAATNRNLQAMVEDGAFRKDLWYRLNVFPIHIPPLRERKADIPALVSHFVALKTRELNLPFAPQYEEDAMDQLTTYDWPGNVRELQNVIERTLILSRGKPLSFAHLESSFDTKGSADALSVEDHFPTMEELTIRHIRKGLDRSGGKINGPGGAAELLDMHPQTLRSRMKKLGIKLSYRIEE